MADSETDLQVDGKSVYSLRVVDLKQELKKREIPFKGNATKAQLQSLLIQHLNQTTEANDDKSSEANSGTTVQSDNDTNDTIESNPDNSLSLGNKQNEQTEATDLSQDSGITSSVSFGDRQSIKLTIKLGNDSPTKHSSSMSPKKSPTKEMRSPPIEPMKKTVDQIVEHLKPIETVKEVEKTPIETVEETKVVVPEEVKENVQDTSKDVIVEKQKIDHGEPKVTVPIKEPAIVEEVQKLQNNATQGMSSGDNSKQSIVETHSEKIDKREIEVKGDSGGDVVQEKTIEHITESKPSEEVSTQSNSSKVSPQTKQKSELKHNTEHKMIEIQEQKQIETQEVIPTPKEDSKPPKIADESEKIKDSNSEKQVSDILMNQEIVLTEEVTDDLSESKVETSENEHVQQTIEKPIEKVEEITKGDQKEEKEKSEVKSDKAKPPRRRRWGGSVSSDAQQSLRRGISSDQLKELIPDLDSNDNSNTTSKVSKSESIVVTSSLSRTPTETNSEVPVKQDIRVVRKSVSVSEEDQTPAKPPIPVAKPKAKISVENNSEPKEEEAKRAVSPPRKPESNILFIQNLVRPFTLLQLKEVLGKTGKLVEERFWIDKIKSKCFVTYETKEEAVATRLALHGTQWPTSNPKLLCVDFATSEELDSYLNPEVKQEANKRIDSNQKYDIVIRSEEQKTVSRDKENKNENRPIREWDREKLSHKEDDKRTVVRKREESPGTKSQERENKRRRTGEERVRPADSTSGEPAIVEPTKETESPAKLLDDLFRKTNATPSIYWLPLTEEQATARSAIREEEMKKRAEERLAREEQFRKRQEENRRPFDVSPPFRNERRRPDSPNRRPFGRRGSPPFRRSPPGRRSPPRRRSPLNRYSRSRSRSPIPRRKR